MAVFDGTDALVTIRRPGIPTSPGVVPFWTQKPAVSAPWTMACARSPGFIRIASALRPLAARASIIREMAARTDPATVESDAVFELVNVAEAAAMLVRMPFGSDVPEPDRM